MRNESLRRGVSVLRVLARAGGPVTGAEVARRAGLAPATAARLLATLADETLAVRDPGGAWRLGPGVAELAGTEDGIAALAAAAKDVLRGLAEETGETAVLTRVSLPDLAEVLVQEDADRLLGATSWIGRAFDPRHSVAGWVVAGSLDPAEAAAIGGDEPDVRDAWLAHVAAARARGYAIDVDGLEPGLTSIAVLLPSSAHAVAVGIAGPSARLTPARAEELVPRIRSAAGELSSLI